MVCAVDGFPSTFEQKSIKRTIPLKIGLEHCQHLKEHDPSDTAPPILKEKEDGVPKVIG